MRKRQSNHQAMRRKAGRCHTSSKDNSGGQRSPMSSGMPNTPNGSCAVNGLKFQKPSLKSQGPRTSKDSDSDSDEEVLLLSNVKVKVIRTYVAKTDEELTITKGQTVHQKYQANEKGMAYGWIRRHFYSRKIYGSYPGSCVVLKNARSHERLN